MNSETPNQNKSPLLFKRQRLEDAFEDDDDFDESDEEKPTIVVLKKGDLTKEEAENIEKG